MSDIALADDLLIGAQAISRFMFGSDGQTETRRTYHLISEVAPEDRLPSFRCGGPKGPVYARKSTILAWIAEREARR